MKESRWRTVFKGITWRIVSTFTTMLVVYVVTGNLALVASVGLLDALVKMFFYYLHERIWGRVHWGWLGIQPNIKQ